MRVLYLCADPGIPLDGVKGASIHVRQTVGALADRGVDVVVAALRPGERADLDAVVVPVPERIRSAASFPGAEREARLVTASVELAHAAAEAAGRIDVIYERYSLWSLAGVTLADRLGVPLALEVNAPLVEEQARFRTLELPDLAAGIERTVVRRADGVLCVSRPLVERASRIRGSEACVTCTPNVVDVDRFTPRKSPAPERTPTIAFVGSLKPWHGLDRLVKAFARVRARDISARLMLIGDGPERPALEALAVEHGIAADLVFTGAVDHDDVPDLLRECDVAVAPYPPIENFYFSPLKLAEYLAAGLPTVCSRLPGIDDGLVDGESVVLVPPGDVDALADRIAGLLLDPARRARIGAAARRAAVESFSLEAAVDRLLALLGSLTSARPVAPSPGGSL